ncbi:hypothetical protein IWW35_006602, partial [Coemansia sp. RSA 1878]
LCSAGSDQRGVAGRLLAACICSRPRAVGDDACWTHWQHQQRRATEHCSARSACRPVGSLTGPAWVCAQQRRAAGTKLHTREHPGPDAADILIQLAARRWSTV